jgi:hypothetical protein
LKLHSPSFEKSLRRGVRKAVQSSPALKQEYRNAKKAIRRRVRVEWLFRPIFSCILGFLVWFVIETTHHPVTALAIISIWNLLLLSAFTQNLLLMLFRANDLSALLILPISESAIFQWKLQKFFRKFAMLSVLDQIVGFGVLGFCLHFSYAQWILAMTLAILSWVMLLALTALCAARLPRLKYQIITSSIYLFGFVLLMAHKLIGNAVLAFIDSMAPRLNLLLPTGWIPSLFQLILPEGQWMIAGLIVPVVFVIYTIKKSLELLRSQLKYKEHVTREASDQIPGREHKTAATDETIKPSSVGATAIEEIIQSRQFLFQEQPQGWFERRLWEWLNPREKSVAEFAFARGFSITKPWKTILRNFLLMVVAGFVVGMVSLTVEFWIFGIGLFITFCQCLAQILGNGTAFRVMFNSGVRIPIYAAYPITFRELSGTLFKSAVIQLPLFIIYTMACAVLIAHLTGLDFSKGIILGFKVGFLVFAGRFITTTLAFSSCTNDSTRFRIRTIALIPLFLGGVGLFLVLGGAALFVSNALVAWLLWLIALFDAYALFRIYGWFYHANSFDLMSFPRR